MNLLIYLPKHDKYNSTEQRPKTSGLLLIYVSFIKHLGVIACIGRRYLDFDRSKTYGVLC